MPYNAKVSATKCSRSGRCQPESFAAITSVVAFQPAAVHQRLLGQWHKLACGTCDLTLCRNVSLYRLTKRQVCFFVQPHKPLTSMASAAPKLLPIARTVSRSYVRTPCPPLTSTSHRQLDPSRWSHVLWCANQPGAAPGSWLSLGCTCSSTRHATVGSALVFCMKANPPLDVSCMSHVES
jgi:hypothetical protein